MPTGGSGFKIVVERFTEVPPFRHWLACPYERKVWHKAPLPVTVRLAAGVGSQGAPLHSG